MGSKHLDPLKQLEFTQEDFLVKLEEENGRLILLCCNYTYEQLCNQEVKKKEPVKLMSFDINLLSKNKELCRFLDLQDERAETLSTTKVPIAQSFLRKSTKLLQSKFQNLSRKVDKILYKEDFADAAYNFAGIFEPEDQPCASASKGSYVDLLSFVGIFLEQTKELKERVEKKSKEEWEEELKGKWEQKEALKQAVEESIEHDGDSTQLPKLRSMLSDSLKNETNTSEFFEEYKKECLKKHKDKHSPDQKLLTLKEIQAVQCISGKKPEITTPGIGTEFE